MQVGGSGGGWIAVVNESRCQVVMGMEIMHMGVKQKNKKQKKGGGVMVGAQRKRRGGMRVRMEGRERGARRENVGQVRKETLSKGVKEGRQVQN